MNHAYRPEEEYVGLPRYRYHGALTDTNRWQRIALRKNDILVCTPPKCGTTWTQSIVAMLVAGTTNVDASASTLWLDSEISPIDEVAARFDAMSTPRYAKTHTPLDGVPYESSVRYVTVYRHPIDALLSVRKHIKNLNITNDDHPYLRALPDVFDHFLTASLDRRDADEMTLAGIAHHYDCTAQISGEPNVLVLHYADMTRDPGLAIRAIATHLGIDTDDQAVELIIEATSFASMKAAATRFAPHAAEGIYDDPSAFFDTGGTRKWEGQLDAERISRFEERLEELLSPDGARWLLQGTGST